MSLRLTTTRLAQRATSNVQAGVFAWTRPGRDMSTHASSSSSWSGNLSYTSPESDFTTASLPNRRTMSSSSVFPLWSETLRYASPESDFGGMPMTRRSMTTVAVSSPSQLPSWSQTLGFASAESDFTQAIDHARPVHEYHTPTPLPVTWADALHTDNAAIVITTAQAPHRVVHVNAAWEHLCGYDKTEALYKPIGPLLQNDVPKSHTHQAARHLMQQLQRDHFTVERDAYLENFTKAGKPFLNHVRVGPLYMDQYEAMAQEEPEFLVAILEEVQREQVPLRIVV